MESRILGIPFAIILFIVLIVTPLLYADFVLYKQIAKVQSTVSKPVVLVPAVIPSATPSAAIKVTPTVAAPTVKVFKSNGIVPAPSTKSIK